MTQMIALIEGLPEAMSLLLLGTSLLVAGLLLRKALRAYERVVARREVPALQGTRAEAGLQVAQVSSYSSRV
jgi:ABC-type enterochelin transport system permease subunit